MPSTTTAMFCGLVTSGPLSFQQICWSPKLIASSYLKATMQLSFFSRAAPAILEKGAKSVSPVLAGRWPDKELILKKLNYYSRLKRVLAHLGEHATEPMALDQAAKIACMERTSFSRLFSRVAGITFREFLQQWRIAIAVEYMVQSDVSLTEIAYLVGFESMSAFERTFKKVTTLNPSEYRKLLLAGYWEVARPTTAD